MMDLPSLIVGFCSGGLLMFVVLAMVSAGRDE